MHSDQLMATCHRVPDTVPKAISRLLVISKFTQSRRLIGLDSWTSPAKSGWL